MEAPAENSKPENSADDAEVLKWRAYHKAYHATHKDERRAIARRYREKYPEKEKAKNAKWRANNLLKIKAKNAEYRVKHLDTIKKESAEYRKKNLAKIKARDTAWRKANPEKNREKGHRWRVRVKGANSGPSKPIVEWERVWRGKQFAICFWCRTRKPTKKCQTDHIVAVSIGGAHEIGNLCISCRSCNARKCAKTVAEWNKSIAQPVLL